MIEDIESLGDQSMQYFQKKANYRASKTKSVVGGVLSAVASAIASIFATPAAGAAVGAGASGAIAASLASVAGASGVVTAAAEKGASISANAVKAATAFDKVDKIRTAVGNPRQWISNGIARGILNSNRGLLTAAGNYTMRSATQASMDAVGKAILNIPKLGGL
ncbi:hypothetical protein [Capybara microvirus Cap1_SP_76]|nr:hypothetical protein [Capybara microvirus Cap1_SP_76]